MSKRVLAIGIGGTGKAALTILKERLEESYGIVPDNVVLLSLDTDNLRPEDVFAGSRLTDDFDERKREPEFRYVVSKPGVTMDTIFADIARGTSTSYMSWLEHQKLDKILAPADRNIRGGAQQRRPIGRVALFQNWDNPVYDSILNAIVRMYGEPDDDEQKLDPEQKEQSKRLIFIVGSVAGGTGSGFLVDVANLVRRAVNSNQKFQSVDVSAVVVLPDAFSKYTTAMNDPTNLKPNSYAALRELDRFTRAHSAALPYMVRYGDDVRSITWSTAQILDHVYLVDTASPSGAGESDLSGDPLRGVFPIISDFIMAHVDNALGDGIATLRSNAGTNSYNKEEGWQYSSFNVMTYIFPVEDVIQSFSYRFLREALTRQYLPVQDKKIDALVKDNAARECERVFGGNDVLGKINPGVIQKTIACTRKMETERETPDVSWRGLFNLIALSDESFAKDHEALDGWLRFLDANLMPTGEGENRRESYDDGYVRLIGMSDKFMDDCLGTKYDQDNESARANGQWDAILVRYREALRKRFAEALDAEMLDIMNRRDPNSKVLMEHQLPFGRFVLATLKEKLVQFKQAVRNEYADLRVDERIRVEAESVREQIGYMQDTKDSQTFALFGKPRARLAQDAYIDAFKSRMEMLMHQKIYATVMDVLDSLGASDVDKDKNNSIMDIATLELDNWQVTLREADKLLADWSRAHEKNREQKRKVKVRRYLTDEKFEEELYRRPEHADAVALRVLGQVRGENGVFWQRNEETVSLKFKMMSTFLKETARGPEQIAAQMLSGMRGLFQVVRESATVADRIKAMFTSPTSFVGRANTITEPFLRYNPSTNNKSLFVERYMSYNVAKAQDDARNFLEEVNTSLRGQGVNVVSVAENGVAATVLEISRGAKLDAIDQFAACNADYRKKLYEGRESLHLFPEEQNATNYEQQIESLNEAGNRQRFLSPDLVIAIGDDAKLRMFTSACAYGLITSKRIWNDERGVETTEIVLNYNRNGAVAQELQLSDSFAVRGADVRFDSYPAEEQESRLYLNALQNFALKATQKAGVQEGLVANLVDDLKKQGVNLGAIKEPFTLASRDVGVSLKAAIEKLAVSKDEQTDDKLREKMNAQKRAKLLEGFVADKIVQFKGSPAQRIKDVTNRVSLNYPW